MCYQESMRRAMVLTLTALLLVTAVAVGKASHAGWPVIDGKTVLRKAGKSGPITGTAKSDELAGSSGNDIIRGLGASDVIWGAFDPSVPQYASQYDQLYGGAGRDFIYASHGRDLIEGGPGNDVIHAHFGRGSIDCGPGHDLLYLSHKSKRVYKVRNCEQITFRHGESTLTPNG